jgi:hypothetical protein
MNRALAPLRTRWYHGSMVNKPSPILQCHRPRRPTSFPAAVRRRLRRPSKEPGRPAPEKRTSVENGAAMRLPEVWLPGLSPDDRLTRPEIGQFGEAVIEGVWMMCMAAKGRAHRSTHLVSVCLAEGYVASAEFTRTGSDFTPARPCPQGGVDPETGGRDGRLVPGGDLLEVANTRIARTWRTSGCRSSWCAANLRRPGPGGDVTVLGHERIV